MLKKLLLLLTTLIISAQPAWAVTKSWLVADGEWSVGTNWSPTGVPATGDTIIIGDNRTANLSFGTQTIYYMTVGNAAGTGTLNLSGSATKLTVTGDSPIIGEYQNGYLNITDGAQMVVNSPGSGNLCIGKYNSTGIINVSGTGSLLESRNFLHFGHFGGTGIINITDGGTVKSATTIFVLDGAGIINITDGTLQATQLYTNGTNGALNVFGDGSTISLSTNFNKGTQKLASNFYIDSTVPGTSAVNVNAATAGNIDLAGGHRVTAWGFAAQDSGGTFELFTGRNTANFTGTFSLADAPNLKIISPGTDGHFVLGFADDTPIWDLDTEWIFYPDADKTYAGWVKVTGTQQWEITAKFIFPDSTPPGMVDVFLAYLNNGLAASGSGFSLKSRDETSAEFMLPSDFLAATALDMLGWGVLHFNETYGTDIRLRSLTHIPEPTTWIMLLMGGMAIFRLRKTNVNTNSGWHVKDSRP